ncbi:MAG: hypothetical protein HC899_01415 [Leptolyngbyaceae cyanobacterium SM1_4_3]|nr:hypothetical protein [Leptolyngbyaceae cyanobacterium SM1_4_3]NJN91539.1 hypothetical protein [Leptolyngbyaceae cyanobacterium SL_5_14]NJO67269.1 hypothetical protein [Leptolyngbyaceae cyanobacterium RM1_405_57]
MLSYFSFVQRLIHQFTQVRLLQTSCWLSIALVLLLSTGCTQLKLPVQRGDVSLDIRTVTPQPAGVYAIAGNTDLPEGTEITVAAVRLLTPEGAIAADPDPVYSLLAYESVKTEGDTWQAELNLWEVDPDGRYQETWQLEQSRLEITFEADGKVIFLATLAPLETLTQLQQRLAQRGLEFASNIVRTTAEGEQYIQAVRVEAIALPTGTTTPPITRPEDLNGGWGNRYVLVPEPPTEVEYEFPEERKTDAPARLEEFLQ